MATKTKLTAKEKEALEAQKQSEAEDRSAAERRDRITRMLKETPPGRLLEAALKQNDVFHAYLFYGPGDSLKDDAAMTFAASILTGSDHLVLERREPEASASVITQMHHGEHSDFIFLDGSRREAIKKEEVDMIQRRFSLTASSERGTKVYVITHAENSSLSAMNSLLKFLEEPAENVYAILTADNIERILPTIRSRCITVPFQALSRETLIAFCEEEGLDEEDIFFVSIASPRPNEAGKMAAGRSYQTAKRMLRQYLNIDASRDLLFADYEYRYRSKAGNDDGEGVRYKDARDENLDTLDLYFRFLVQFFHDVLKNDGAGPSWYHDAVTAMQRRNDYVRICTEQMKIAAEARDKVNRNNDLSLLLAQTISRLEDSEHVQ